MFRQSLDSTFEKLNSGMIEESHLQSLTKSAGDYFLAKIDQPMNARRTARFVAAQGVELIIGKYQDGQKPVFSNKELLENVIASKITFEAVKQSLKGDDIKKDASISDPKAFQATVDAVKHMDGFKAFTNSLDSKKMAQVCSKNPKDLHKAMLKAEIAVKKEHASSQKAISNVNKIGPADKTLNHKQPARPAGPGLG